MKDQKTQLVGRWDLFITWWIKTVEGVIPGTVFASITMTWKKKEEPLAPSSAISWAAHQLQ